MRVKVLDDLQHEGVDFQRGLSIGLVLAGVAQGLEGRLIVAGGNVDFGKLNQAVTMALPVANWE